ncbi:hypothetical protein GCM10023324_56100 [Streptomyces youssoufiensis]
MDGGAHGLDAVRTGWALHRTGAHRVGALHRTGCGVRRVRQVLVAHRLQGGVGVSVVVGVGDDVLDEADDAAGDAGHRRGGGVARPVPQRGQCTHPTSSSTKESAHRSAASPSTAVTGQMMSSASCKG